MCKIYYGEVSIIRNKRKKFWVLAALLCLLCFGAAQQTFAAANVVTSAKTVYGGKWKTTSAGRMYRYSKTAYAKNGWRRIGKQIYYFNKKGICQTGWFNYEGNRYYADKKGRLYIGRWAEIGGKRYYFAKDGRLQKSKFIKSGNKYYYVNKNGVNVKSRWVTVKGKKYYIDNRGARLQKIWYRTKEGKFYYFESNGVMATNKFIRSAKGGYYYVGKDGVRTSAPKDLPEEYIFVGDSRTVGMEMARKNSHTTYIGKVSMGYSWLVSDAGKRLEKELEQNPYAKVIFAFGINDLGNVQSYITYYKKMMREYPDAKIYVMAVNPVANKQAAAHGYRVKNSDIKAFNKKMKAAFGSAYIDTYTYLKNHGFSTSDGIHYTAATYGDIYDYVMALIK